MRDFVIPAFLQPEQANGNESPFHVIILCPVDEKYMVPELRTPYAGLDLDAEK